MYMFNEITSNVTDITTEDIVNDTVTVHETTGCRKVFCNNIGRYRLQCDL